MQQNRRGFLKVTGIGSASVLTTGLPSEVAAAQALATKGKSEYPEMPIAQIRNIEKHTPVTFYYPDKASPCLLVKTGKPVPNGIGIHQDIVAFSAMCTHMGCTVYYDSDSETMKCPCHFSVFDPEESGQMVCGHATADLPRIHLKEDARTGQLLATGITGLLYGRASNML
jgi:arsenite oxidase small subunit